MKKEFGILMPVSSLPSRYGIGSFGDGAAFIDFLSAAGAKYWQVLPLGQTGFGNSPYQSPSSDCLNPYFISLDILKSKGLITARELNSAKCNSKYVDYGKLYAERYPLLRIAFERFDCSDTEFVKFVKRGEYKSYALFMAIKQSHNGAPFCDWEHGLKFRDKKALSEFEKNNKDELLFWQFLQYEASLQWSAVKSLANEKGIKIIGDMPLYPAYDSADVWEQPQLFKLDENLAPVKVAGVPPDYFSENGQLWGNPVFDYESQSKDNFKWWTNRLVRALTHFDIVRIDHFRGLDRYYEIDSNAADAKNGNWVDVPSDELFAAIGQKVKNGRIIAEDLGILDDGVYALLKKTGLPGMCVLSFAFNGEKDNQYLPENIGCNSVCYTGTHDNDTLIGLISSASEWDKKNLEQGVKSSLVYYKRRMNPNTPIKLARAITELGFMCDAKLFILPMQDILLKGGDYRMNEPGSDCVRNWCVRFTRRDIMLRRATRIAKLQQKYRP